MNQAELRLMAVQRIRDAKALLRGGRWEFAYYVSGYAVECALKSCVLARMIHTAWVFQDKWQAKECLTHDFDELIRLAGLKHELDTELAASAATGGLFAAHWGTVSKWTVTSRYVPKTQAEAEQLFEAITHRPDGVLRWLRKFW